MGVRRDRSRQELLQLGMGRAHGQLTVRVLEEIPDLLSGRLFRYLGFDRGGAAEGNSTHGLFIIAIPRFGISRRAGLVNSSPGAGRLQVCMHGDVPLTIVGTGEDGSHGSHGGERGRHCVSISRRRSSASECKSGEEEKTLSASKSACQPLTTSVVDALYLISVKVHSSSAHY